MFIERGDCVSLTAQCNTARGEGSSVYVDVQCLTSTWGESLDDDLCLHGLLLFSVRLIVARSGGVKARLLVRAVILSRER